MATDTAAFAAKREARPYWRVMMAALVLPLLLLIFGLHRPDNVTFYLQTTQNAQLLMAEVALVGLALIPIKIGPAALKITGRQVALLALASAFAGYVGHYWLLGGYDLSRDEQMATFDAMIYGAGHLVWPIPPQWQAAPNLLDTLFMLPVPHPVAWVSAYLPGNSLLRAGFGKLGDPALTGPVLDALSVLLLWGATRRIWTGRQALDQEAGCVAILLLVLSGQFEFSGMTSFAMTAHLTCNLLWLWLFLRDRRGSDLASLAVSFVGTGLHQPLFHPLFIAPFLVLLLVDRRWARFALLAGCNLAILAFWFAWPFLTQALVTGAQVAAQPAIVGTSYYSRLMWVLGLNHDNAAIMASNLLHYVTWQHLLLLPLLIAGIGAARYDRLAAALAAGLLLPIVIMTLILPWQGHGFGYRYLHGVLGNAALLGGYGWRRLAPWHARLRPLFVRASVTSLLALALQAWLTHAMYSVYADIDAKINAVRADYIIIGEHDTPLASDYVLNRPDLKNHPIRLAAGEIDDADALAQRICRPGVIVGLPSKNFFRPIMRYYEWPDSGIMQQAIYSEGAAFGEGGCTVTVLQ